MTSSSSRVSNEFNQSTSGDGDCAAIGTGSATGEHECVKIAQFTSTIEGMHASIHVGYLSRRRSSRLAKSSRCGRGGGPDHLRRTGHDAHLHLHAEVVRRKSDIGAMKRDRVARIGDNCYGDKVDVADAAACRIEINPSGVRQINLRPGMSSIRDLSCSTAPADRPRGLRDAIVPGSVVEKMLQVGATFDYSSRSFLKVRLYSL